MSTGFAPTPAVTVQVGIGRPRRMFAPPDLHPELVQRAALVERLRQSAHMPLVVVTAPPGHGKTTLLAQWAVADPRPAAWLTLSPRHADPHDLLADIVAALGEVASIDPDLPALVGGDDAPPLAEAVTRVGDAMRCLDAPVVIVIDDAHLLQGAGPQGVVRALVRVLPHGCQIALAGRREPGLPLGALRAKRMLEELHAADLALEPDEACRLLANAGLRVDARQLGVLMDRTEGWAAGLYMAALSLRGEPALDAAVDRFAGDDRIIVAYFLDEVIADAPPETAEFMFRTSVLDRFTAPLCAHLLDSPQAGDVLQDLAEANMFVTRLDTYGEWFRYHRLLAEALRSVLARGAAEETRVLHRRAGDWLAANGDPVAAVAHLIAGGDADRAAGLVWAGVPAHQATGRLDTLTEMIAAFPVEEVSRRAPLALAAAWAAVEGSSHQVEHWLHVAEHTPFHGPLPGGPSGIGSALALLRATVARDGVGQMGRDAAAAYAEDVAGSPWRSLACLLRGVASHLQGDERTGQALIHEAEVLSGPRIPTVHALCLTWRSVISLISGDWTGTEALIARASDQVEGASLQSYPSVALLRAVQALDAARNGDRDTSHAHQRDARALLARISDVAPWFGVMSRILLSRAAMQTGDADVARTLLAEAHTHHLRVPDSPVLDAQLAASRDAVEGLPAGALLGPGSLTTAELRVLDFLPTHLSFREIGERLYLSRFTIKSQALSAYRKLGVTSRGEAVARARALGLLSG